jgi:hypothetical protein
MGTPIPDGGLLRNTPENPFAGTGVPYSVGMGAWEQAARAAAALKVVAQDSVAAMSARAREIEAKSMSLLASKIPNADTWATPFIKVGAIALGVFSIGPLFGWLMMWVKDSIWWVALLLGMAIVGLFGLFLVEKMKIFK